MTTKNIPVSYAIGDIVKVNKTGETGPITDTSCTGNYIQYGCCGSAWYDFDAFTFISRATEKSLKEVTRLNEEEFGEEF